MTPAQREAFLAAVREREAKATPGPWRWWGNTGNQDVALTTVGLGTSFVMRFARWGMQSAQPLFAVGRKWGPDPKYGDLQISPHGRMSPVTDLPVYEVAPGATSPRDPRVYRQDLVGIRHPDAEFIAHSREDIRGLLEVIDGLQAELRDAWAGAAGATQEAAL